VVRGVGEAAEVGVVGCLDVYLRVFANGSNRSRAGQLGSVKVQLCGRSAGGKWWWRRW
jgi:hypothetical protein